MPSTPAPRTLLRLFLLIGGVLALGYGLRAGETGLLVLGALGTVLGGFGLAHQRWDRGNREAGGGETGE